MRLDHYLALQKPELSRSRIQALIEQGHVLVNRKSSRASYQVKNTDHIDVHVPPPKPTELIPENIALELLYVDDDIIVLNKPAGLVVHPGAGHDEGTLVHALLHHFPDIAIGGTERPGIVHRLDKETSGVMVCARHDEAHRKLSQNLKDRQVEKIYHAFCVGTLGKKHFELKTGHRRHTTNRKRFTTKVPLSLVDVSKGIRLAYTEFDVVNSACGVTELMVKLHTGRTHQIRAHLADIGHPLLQDELYGGKKATQKLADSIVKDNCLQLTRQALHAERLSFSHPSSGEWVSFVAPLPADLQAISEALKRVVCGNTSMDHTSS